jgi:phosphate:Na+ symporter
LLAKIIMGMIGGLGLFIYGIQLMGDGLQKAAGDRLRKIIEILTTKPWRGVLVGAGITALIQSSSATTVMTVGFVNAGIMTLPQAVGVIMGANIGTTMTAQLIAFQLDKYSLPAVGLGFGVMFFSKRRTWKYFGQTILGFGLLFLGMTIMKDTMAPLKEYPGFINFMATFGTTPVLGVLVGTGMTVMVQSSSATIGIAQALAFKGLLSIREAIPIIFGDNIGTCITAVLASIGTSLSARRAAAAHVLFNIFGTIIFMLGLPLVYRFATMTSGNVARQIANTHTSFNLVNTLFWLPLVAFFTKMVIKLVPGKELVIEKAPIYLDKNVMMTPSIALDLATRETARMGGLTSEMLDESVALLSNKIGKSKVKEITHREEVVDVLAEEITVYLSELSQHSLSQEQSERLTGLMHAVNDIERVGDHAENIMQLATNKVEDRLKFTPGAREELDQIYGVVKEFFGKMIEGLESGDRIMVGEYRRLEYEVDRLVRTARKEHLKRLKEGECHPIAGVIFLDLLNNLERIGDHANNVGYVALGELHNL